MTARKYGCNVKIIIHTTMCNTGLLELLKLVIYTICSFMYAHTHAHTHTRTHAHTRTRAHTHKDLELPGC